MKIHVGYIIAAVGYMFGIFLLSSLPESATANTPGPSVLWNLLHIPLFAGLASCLLLSVSNGEWRRRVPVRLYAATALVAIAYAAFDEWHQSSVVGRYASLPDLLLNLIGIGGLFAVHWFAGRQGADS